jgi:signal transduction histidine kinase
VSAALGLAGWLLGLTGLALAMAVQRQLASRMELVARACHEVRGPLTAARLALHLAGSRDGAERPPVAAVDLELRRAGLALDDLHAARSGRRARDCAEPVAVADLLRATAEAWRPVARARGSDLRLEPVPSGTRVTGDRLRLAQACGNLVANAIEHGRGPVAVRARSGWGRVRIEVADRGPGLPRPIPELTRRARAGRGGRGRGLAISAEIAARHGGRLGAAPSDGGACVTLELPLAGHGRPFRA